MKGIDLTLNKKKVILIYEYINIYPDKQQKKAIKFSPHRAPVVFFFVQPVTSQHMSHLARTNSESVEFELVHNFSQIDSSIRLHNGKNQPKFFFDNKK